MPLQGTFDVLAFADVLELLATREMTGRLHVRSRSTRANIYMEKGRLVGTQVGEQVNASADDARGRLNEVCFELLPAELGSFEFNPDLTGMAAPTMSVEVGEALTAARSQLEEWREIQTVIPSLDVRPDVVAELPGEEVTLSRPQWRLLVALDGRRSLRAVARLLDLTDYSAARTLRTMIEAGIVELDADARPAPGAGRQTTVFVDDTIDWAQETGNGQENGATPTDDGAAVGSGPAVDGHGPDAVVSTTPASNNDAKTDDSIWRGNVEDSTAKETDQPPASPPPVAGPVSFLPPAPIVAPPSSGTTPATPTAVPTPPHRHGLNWLGRKSRPPRPEA